MNLYHGTSYRDIKKFKIIDRKQHYPDFGTGLYFTSNFEQAKQWSCSKSAKGAIYEIDIDLEELVGKNLNNDELFYYLVYLCRIDLQNLVEECLDELDNVDYVYGKMIKKVNHFKLNAEKFNSGDIDMTKLKKYTNFHNDDMNQYVFRTNKSVELINKSIIKKYYTKKIGNNIIVEIIN